MYKELIDMINSGSLTVERFFTMDPYKDFYDTDTIISRDYYRDNFESALNESVENTNLQFV